MMISLNEYNVTPDVNKKDKFNLQIDDDKIICNEIEFDNQEKIKELINWIISQKDEILKLCELKCPNYKGGRQQILTIDCKEISDSIIRFQGNTSNTNVSEFYIRFKEKVLSYLN